MATDLTAPIQVRLSPDNHKFLISEAGRRMNANPDAGRVSVQTLIREAVEEFRTRVETADKMGAIFDAEEVRPSNIVTAAPTAMSDVSVPGNVYEQARV